jgi:hypothetical protein
MLNMWIKKKSGIQIYFWRKKKLKSKCSTSKHLDSLFFFFFFLNEIRIEHLDSLLEKLNKLKSGFLNPYIYNLFHENPKNLIYLAIENNLSISSFWPYIFHKLY